jgi:hypothetical protein
VSDGDAPQPSAETPRSAVGKVSGADCDASIASMGARVSQRLSPDLGEIHTVRSRGRSGGAARAVRGHSAASEPLVPRQRGRNLSRLRVRGAMVASARSQGRARPRERPQRPEAPQLDR